MENITNNMRQLSPMEIYNRAVHDDLWDDGSGFDGEGMFQKNSKGQLFHEWMRDIQNKFVTEVGDDEDLYGNKIVNHSE